MIFDKLVVDIPQVILRRPAQSVTVWVLHIMYCVMEDIWTKPTSEFLNLTWPYPNFVMLRFSHGQGTYPIFYNCTSFGSEEFAFSFYM